MQHRVWVLCAQEGAREDHRVEGNVVFAHELVELDIIGVFPPLVPVLLCVAGSNRQVANGGIEPHIENLVGILFQGDGGAPLEVTGDASALQTLLKKS